MEKPIMTLCETNSTYRATVNNTTVTISKDIIEIQDGIRQHPRLLAIREAASKAQISDYILLNIREAETMENKINIHAFLKQFNKEYDFLYNSKGYVAGYNEAVNAFDTFLHDNIEFVSEFARFRNDPVTSDREAAAFMFALDAIS